MPDPNDDRVNNVNPPHHRVIRDSPEVAQAKAFIHHRNAGSMEDYYALYPMDRPRGRSDQGRGR